LKIEFPMQRLTLIFVCLLLPLNSIAEHEADHRYNVRGYILDANERAIADREVVISADGNLLASGKTDSYGYYSLHLHLHNEDRGRLLSLKAGPQRAEIRVDFDPQDRQTARVHDASLVGGSLIEKPLDRWRIPLWIYPLAGFVVLGFVLVALERRRKHKLRSKHLAKAPPSRSRHGRKKRRKNR
jgi:hypothetical protein